MNYTEASMQEPIVASGPPPVAAEQRNWIGWSVLAAIFVLLIGAATSSYFDRGTSSPSFTTVESALRMHVSLTSGAPAGGAAAIIAGSVESLRAPLRRVQPLAGTNHRAARLTLILQRELKVPASETALKTLRESKRTPPLAAEMDRLFAKAYAGNTESRDLAKFKELAASGRFSDKLAAAQIAEQLGDQSLRKALVPEGSWRRIMGGFGIAGLCLMVGAVVLIAGFLGHTTGGWKTVGLGPRAMNLSDADRYAYRMALFMVFFLLAQVVAGLALTPLLIQIGGRGLAVGSGVAVFGLTFAYVWWMVGRNAFGVADGMKRIMGDTTQLFTKSMIGVGGFLANLPIIVVLVVIISPLQGSMPEPTHPLNETLGASPGELVILLAFLAAAVGAPLLEEITFRGLLFPALNRLLNSVWGAILLQGFLFAAIHPQGPLAWPMLAAVGSMAAFLAHKTGSLVPAIAMHAAHNAAILTFSTLVLG